MTTVARRRTFGGWEAGALRAMEFVAYPALAGAACCVLSLGVVTWLPALAAAAHALHRWRAGDDARCFTGAFAAFGRCWRLLWRHGLVSTVAVVLLVVNVDFLAGRPEPLAFGLLAVQVGIGIAALPYHLALAATVAIHGDARPGTAVLVAFGSARRGLALVGASLLTAVGVVLLGLTGVLAVAPLLCGIGLLALLALRAVSLTRFPDTNEELAR